MHAQYAAMTQSIDEKCQPMTLSHTHTNTHIYTNGKLIDKQLLAFCVIVE